MRSAFPNMRLPVIIPIYNERATLREVAPIVELLDAGRVDAG